MAAKPIKPKKKILPKPEKAISLKQSMKIINERYGDALDKLAK